MLALQREGAKAPSVYVNSEQLQKSNMAEECCTSVKVQELREERKAESIENARQTRLFETFAELGIERHALVRYESCEARSEGIMHSKTMLVRDKKKKYYLLICAPDTTIKTSVRVPFRKSSF